jgi:U3 small nucleolar RNA-associated protein MPP10
MFYRDFFEPPLNVQRTSFNPISNSQVRFHGNVRVRKIKATGKNRSLRDDDLDDDFMLDEDDSGSGTDDDDDDDEKLDVQNDSQDSEEGSEDESPEGATIQRLKLDLFAEEVLERRW